MTSQENPKTLSEEHLTEQIQQTIALYNKLNKMTLEFINLPLEQFIELYTWSRIIEHIESKKHTI